MSAQRQRASSLHDVDQAYSEADLVIDNSGESPGWPRVPGLAGGHDVHLERTADQRFTQGFGNWAQDRMISPCCT